MQALLLAFSSGAFSSAFWPVLPPPWIFLCLISLCLPLLARPVITPSGIDPPSRLQLRPGVLMSLFAGMLWAAIWGQYTLSRELPAEFDKTDYRVRGVVLGLPDRDARRIKFQLRVDHVANKDEQTTGGLADVQSNVPALHTLSLSWYGGESLIPGQEWQFVVRLRHPRGFANPGGFDYRSWLFRSGVSATGYVRKSEDNVRLPDTEGSGEGGVDGFRYRIAQHIQQLPLNAQARGLLAALTVGDKRGISATTWQQLQRTGTVHLAIISGLHIGLAALVGTLLGYGLGRVVLLKGGILLPRQLGVLLGWATGFVYASLAGFSLPTLRAFVMLSVFVLMFLLRRNASPFTSLLWAWAVVSVVEPLAMLAPGFWLSFTAVAVLIAYFRARPQFAHTYVGRIRQLVYGQWVLLLGLAGGLVFFQGELPLVMPVVNLLVVPWIGFLVVPLCLLGVALFTVYQPWADICWQLAGVQLEWFSGAVARLSADHSWLWVPSFPGGPLPMIALVCAGLLLLSPRGLKLQGLGALIIFAVVFAKGGRDADVPLAMTVLDVGQGLAVVVETPEGVLVYDTGPGFSERFDAGSGIVAPYLRHRGYRDLRMLMVSHSDQDHSGGVTGLLRYYQPETLLLGSPEVGVGGGGLAKAVNYRAGQGQSLGRQSDRRQCQRGMTWRWGEVDFVVLHPEIGADLVVKSARRKRPQNNNSCVLVIRYREQSIVLTGDIEKTVEWKLLGSDDLPRNVTVLLAPHHGSKSSSGAAFVRHLAPQHVVYSAAYNHHFGHPHARVVSRYKGVGSQQWNTALAGALRFEWQVNGELSVHRARERIRHYWEKPRADW
ncbi:MAG: DNA internalization-related competence protein ComEC/Rec2 [Porticoccaceae bacterium]